jgi:7-cyano-7-deazaguanine synthase
MGVADTRTPVAVLASGGLDSAVLVAELCDRHRPVYPLFVRSGLAWENAELEQLRAFLRAIAREELRPLKVLEQPVRDVYGNHWSITGRAVPDAQSPDAAVFLPGRNLFLIIKAAVWGVLNHVETLAIGSLEANPFPDSTPEFDSEISRLVQRALGAKLDVVRPFARLSKADVLRRGGNLPLELTFSCIHPVNGRHCGTCNKCAERRRGFVQANLKDRTQYANGTS